MITFTESNFEKICLTHSFSEPIESFQEELLLDSKFYLIEFDGTSRGSFGYCENVFDVEGFTVLTHFTLDEEAICHSHVLFERVLTEYDIKSAIVSTKDELFLSLAMDSHKSVTMQAYLFKDGRFAVRPAQFPRNCMIPATDADFPEILKATNNYFDFLLHPRKRHTHQLYMLKDGATLLGLALLEAALITKKTSSLGIYTMEEHRRKGVGRSMMLHLKEICREQGIEPITGCNWYNKKSKATLDSSGFISNSRLLKVEFTDDENWISL